ncbi:reverse transcriptase, partial [Globisporangium splendens]
MGQNDDPLQTPIGATQIRAPDGDDWRATGGRQRVEQATARGDRKMSPKERKADILSYFNDIASSSSSRSSTVPGSLWGGPESLRMAAEALQTKIFVLIETIYRDRKGYSIYKRQSKVNAGVQFLSAKKHACTGKAWEDELRQDRIKAEATNSPLSIVLKFANEHYNSLHFRTLNEPSPPANMTGTSLAKHLQGTERSKTEFKTDRSGQFDYEPVTEDPIEGSDNSSLGGLVWTPPPGKQEKFDPNQLSGSHDWSFASQEKQLRRTPMRKAEDGDVTINLNYGVTIRVAAPDKVIQSKKPRVVYPLPKNAAAHSAIIGKDFFEKAHDQLDELRGRYSSPRDYALATANWWDEAKIALRIRYLEAKNQSEAQMLDHSGGAVGDHNVELSQEFLTTATSIRRAIAECKSKWQASKRDRIFREHMHHERKTSKSFYKRISTKFLDNTIFTLGGTATCGPMRSRELADDMGEGWKSIMQQAPTLQTDIDQILDPGTAVPPSDRLGFLLKPIDSSEIKQAVKKCKRGKAHGPDELGNDWHRDHCDEITGLFELRTVLPWLIHHMQAGFVPGRAIPTTIDVLLAAQQRATSDPAMSRAIALLLDFAKAYDSLDRSFLAQALQHLGFPLKFVRLVKVLHSQTTYKFIVNGFLSRKYNVTSGIRQGCPLAPLLFILALEVLYRKIEESDEIRGVELQAAGCATEVRIGGYADDTTIYLSDPKDISAVFAILDKYGAASGLRVNRYKSAVLPLNKEYSSTEESVSDIHVLQREEHCRYLGIQVGQTPSNASNWSKCIQALRVRLRLARLKTHSVAQRAAIASAVIIPKVLYVARHSWPSTAIVNQLHDLVKQFVWGSRSGKPAKPWMKEEQAELKKMNGGLAVPNIRTELMTMSATAVSKWAITTSHIDQVIGEILLHNTRASSTYITPLDAIPRRPPQLRDNMWTTGAALCESLHSRPYEPRERDNVRWCYEHFKSTIVQTHWDGDVFQIDLSSKMSDRLPGIIAEGRKLRGTFCAEWLPYMTSTADGWLLDSNGSPYKLAHTSLSVGTAQLGDILRWEWIRPGLLYRPQQTNVLRLYNGRRHYNHEWHLHTSEATLTHVDTTLVKAMHTVHSATDCDVMATRDLNGQKVSFHAHPRFTRIVQLWGGNGRHNTTRSFYRQQVAATRTQIGKDTRDAAVNKVVQTAGSLWPGLQLIQWSELHNIPGITAYTAQTLLRLKANRLSMWNYEKADLSCSNPECSQVVQSSVQHLFWECPKAKLVWNYFYALWAKIGITPGHDPATWIFSLDLPDTPRHAWTTIKRHIIGHKCSTEHLQDHLYSVAHMLWRYMSASLIHAIWSAHLRRMDSDPIKSTAEMAIMMTRLEAGMRNLTRLAEAQAGDSDGHTFAAVLKAYVDCFLSQTDAIPLTPSDTRGVYLLFFDGGSRGNPGPGGTGSIIVRVHKDSHTASLIWVASMAYSRKDTTNNFAEYWGLIHGLREVQRSHFEPLYVIGDSALIISQQRMHRSPRQHRLARLYQTSRRLADCIDIRGWYHHYRAFNRMADSAANLAMDTRTSTQVHFPTHRAAFNNLTQDLDNDVMHWLMRRSEDPRRMDIVGHEDEPKYTSPYKDKDKPEQPQCPLKKTKMLSRRLAIEGDSVQKHRDLERTLQEHWEGFQEQWIQETKFPFPLLSSDHDVWTQVALNEWERILAMLKTSSGPHHVLDHLREMDRTLTEQALNLFLPHIASRTAPSGQRSLLWEMGKHFGFTTLEHSTALLKLWFIVTSSIPVLLSRTRVEIVHER